MSSSPSSLAFPAPLVSARFLVRPNRFVMIAESDGRRLTVRCPSPGSLRELLTPNVELLVHIPEDSADRRTDATLVLIRHRRRWVSIDTQLPNRLMTEHLRRGIFAQFAGATEIRREVPVGSSRFDFLLTHPDRKPQLLEIKCCNLVIGDMGYFPDSVSSRAARHVRELAEAVHAGYEPWVVFLITRPDCVGCAPFAEADPVFATAMRAAVDAGVQVLAATHQVTRSRITFDRIVPFCVSPT